MVCYICKTEFTLLAQQYKTVILPPKVSIFVKVYKCKKGHYFIPIRKIVAKHNIPDNLKKEKYIKYKPTAEKLTSEEIEIRGKMPPLDMKNFIIKK